MPEQPHDLLDGPNGTLNSWLKLDSVDVSYGNFS
jgi:hypothetical protein